MKGCSEIDSITLGRHAVYNNLEERKRNSPVSVVKRYGGLSAEGGVLPSIPSTRSKAMAHGLLPGSGPLQL